MSNCIDLQKATFRFKRLDLDLEALKALVLRVKDLPNAPSSEDRDGYIAWWFLSHAEFEETIVGPRSVLIKFGEGRSTHTWRDFGATMLLIGRLAKRSFDLRMLVRDEGYSKDFGWATWNVVPNGGDWQK